MFDTDIVFELTQAELSRPVVELERHVLPGELESIPPGPYLAAILSAVDRSRLNGHDVVQVMEADARMVSYFEALKYRSIAEVAYSPASGPDADVVRDSAELEFAAEEIGSALHLTRRAADSELGFALSLRHRLPRVAQALGNGSIDVRRARVFDRELVGAEPETIESVCDRILPPAPKLTTGQLSARLQRLVMESDPAAAVMNYEQGLSDRWVGAEANPDGTANLTGHQLPPHRVIAIRRKLHRMARRAKNAGDERTMDQLRADIYLDLLQGKTSKLSRFSSSGDRGTVHITTSLETLMGLSETPGGLGGYGPVLADIARQVVESQEDSEWRVSVTDDDGHLIHVGTTKRRPTREVARVVEARYPTCVYPGCRMPAFDCDIDHRLAWSKGGTTCSCQLAPLCRRHHRAKDMGCWKLERTPTAHKWVSPLQHIYTTPHHPP